MPIILQVNVPEKQQSNMVFNIYIGTDDIGVCDSVRTHDVNLVLSRLAASPPTSLIHL